jgi:pimeloyl-ACP methyl ester carboxylesterase
MRFASLLALALLCGVARGAEDEPDPNFPPAPMHEQVLHLPGDPERPVELVVTLFTPDGPGPFPLAVVNHGARGNAAAMPRNRTTMPAYYFLSRGYAVALPMMRGFSGSGGGQTSYSCDFAKMAVANGRDIEGVIAALSDNKRIDTRRVIVAGESFGGWNTLGLGALQPENVRGLVNFGGVIHIDVCPDADGQVLVAAAGRLGAATRIPGLWFYGNDDELGPDLRRRMHDAYVSEGARVEFVEVSPFLNSLPEIFTRPEVIPEWASKIDAFLKRISMPGREIFPQYLPHPWPKPSHFADLANFAAVPWIKDKGRLSYQHFLTMPYPRAFVISPGGISATSGGGFDPLAHAEALCATRHVVCVPYALDDDVVFVKPQDTPPHAAPHVAAIDDVAAVPWVNDKGPETYSNFLSHPPPRAFVVGTGGESAATFGGADPLGRAMALCAKNHIECRPYAVNNEVVWQPPPPPKSLPATHYAVLNDISAVPWVNAASRELYAKFLTLKPPRAFAVAPGGQAASTQGGYDPLGRALKKCRDAGLECRPYAMDDKIVWVRPRGE